MIGTIRGELVNRDADEVIVEVAGIGYRVTVGPAVSASLGEVGSQIFLHIHHHIREDDQHLYGFSTHDERLLFETLLSAHGVGPSLALAIMSVHGPDGLRAAVASEDVAALCLVPGVGKKTAQRLIVELSSRLDTPTASRSMGLAGGQSPGRGDVRDALVALGYSDDEIARALANVSADDDSASHLRAALAHLAEK